MTARVVLRTNEYLLTGKVYQVELFIGDEWYRRDIRCDRDVKMAERLAYDMGAKVEDYRDGAKSRV